MDFTETEPLDPSIEAEIVETGLDAFTKLYESLFPFATEEHGSTEVKKILNQASHLQLLEAEDESCYYNLNLSLVSVS